MEFIVFAVLGDDQRTDRRYSIDVRLILVEDVNVLHLAGVGQIGIRFDGCDIEFKRRKEPGQFHLMGIVDGNCFDWYLSGRIDGTLGR